MQSYSSTGFLIRGVNIQVIIRDSWCKYIHIMSTVFCRTYRSILVFAVIFAYDMIILRINHKHFQLGF